MLKRLSHLTVHKKLVWIILVTMICAMSLATVAVVVYDFKQSKRALERELTVISKIIMERSRAAISFKDKKAAQSNLSSLHINNAVTKACFYLMSGDLFVQYHRDKKSLDKCNVLNFSSDNLFYEGDHLYIKEFSYLNKKPIGVVQIKADLKLIYERLRQFSSLSLLLLIFSSFIVYSITSKLINIIIKPLTTLDNLTSNITRENDYSLRAEKASSDEIGSLVDSFNRMLNTIQVNELQLKEAMLELNEKNKINAEKALTAEEKHEAFKEFFDGVSHDLKQPLNAISIAVDALKNEKNPDTKTKIINIIDRSVTNLNKMFTGLLDKSRFENGLTQVNNEKLDLCHLFSVVANEFKILANDKNISFRTQCNAKIIDSDPQMLERIIRNLISNAIRYTDKGGVLLSSRKRADYTLIEVWDTGRGIEENSISEIFKSHVQLENPNHDPRKGYGLGLSVVKKMVENLGIKIEVKSTVNKGTLMRLKVPLPAEEIEVKNSEIPSISADSQQDNLDDPLSNLSVLIIDDDHHILDAAKITLQGWGMIPYCVNSYDQAVQLAEQLQYKIDILLVDYHLGNDQFGTDLIEELSKKANKEIATIIISGEAPDFLESLREAGFNVLAKPIKLARLRATMTYCITSKNKELQ